MIRHGFLAASAIVCIASAAFAQADRLALQSGPAKDGTPAWFLRGSFPDPGGRTMVDAQGHVTVPPRPERPARAPRPEGAPAGFGISTGSTPGCNHSTVCTRRGGPARGDLYRVEYRQAMGYSFSYPYAVPMGEGGIPAVALDSQHNLWVYKRSPVGVVQLMKFDVGKKLVLEVSPDVIGHQDKAHGMAVDAQDNVWITDAGNATVMKLSPDGKLLMTIGTKGKRGDWDEARGQRLLWQPLMVAFAPNGDLYIAEGHSNESPNDVDSDDPANVIGAARVIHLTADGKFVGQIFGDDIGQGKFEAVHGLAIDPKNGDVWIGDREQYRIVVYTGTGKFVKTLQVKNLVCALNFDPEGNPWMASGQDGQFQKLTRDGKVIGAVGNGMGIGPGQFIEASYWSFDKKMNLYAGDTSVGRVTVMTAPSKK